MQPKRFSEYTPITETDGSEVIPILKDGQNETVRADNLTLTKGQVGLDNVPNLDTTDAVANEHTHANKPVLDATTASFTTEDAEKLDGIDPGPQVNGFVPTPVKTGSYAAQPRDFVPTDATAANATVVLPDAPADRTRIAVKMVKVGGTFVTNITASGSDVINVLGGGATLTLSVLNHGAVMQYDAESNIWYVESDDLPLTQLDIRYGLRYMSATNNGVVANDGTDQTLNIKTFLQAAQAAGAIAYFPPGSYKSSWFYVGAVSIFAIPGTVKILCTQTNDSWNFGPTALGASVLLSSDAAAGSKVLTVASTTGVNAGDVIQVGDTTTLVGWNTSGNVLATPAANLYRVQSVNTGTSQITLSDPLIYAMRTTNNAYFQTTGMTEANGSQTGFSITGLHFECQGGSTSTASFMRLWNLRNVSVDVTANGFTNAGLIMQNCYQFNVRARVSNFLDVAVTGVTGQFGYGVDISGSSAHGDVNVNAHRCRHAVAFVGTGHNVRVTGISAGCTSGAWDAHAGFTDIEFNGCTSVGDSAGFNIRGNRQRVIGGMVDNSTGYGVFIFDNPQDVVVKGLVISNSALEGVHVAAPNSVSSGITIADTQIRNCSTAGIDFTDGGVFSDVNIVNVQIRNVSAGPGIKLNRAVTRGRIRNVIIEDNQGPITTTAGIDVGVAATDVTVDMAVFNAIPFSIGSQKATITLAGASLMQTAATLYNTAGSFTFDVPTGCTVLDVVVIGGGGGGGSGRQGATSSACIGGTGGGGGGMSIRRLKATEVTTPVTVTVGAGGNGGASQANPDTNGVNGTGGGTTRFGNYVQASGGSPGIGGTATTSGNPSGGAGMTFGAPGGSSTTQNGNSSQFTVGCGGAGGAGAGGSITTGNAAGTGGGGSLSPSGNQGTIGSGGAATGANGTAAVAPTTPGLAGCGGGGGGASTAANAQPGGNGGAGAGPGGGGGGGGASNNTFASGAGGAGGAGAVYVIAS